MKPIIFDQSSYRWDKEPELNPLLLKHEFRHLKGTFDCRGYLYRNQVCEHLGIKWDPNDENICYKKENGPIDFTYEMTDFGTYRIFIAQ